jgi:hypothetical protein
MKIDLLQQLLRILADKGIYPDFQDSEDDIMAKALLFLLTK